MVSSLKLAKDMNNTSLEELISSLRSHEIELEQDEPQKGGESISLKRVKKSRKTKALQAEEEEESLEDFDGEDELSLLSRRVVTPLQKSGRFNSSSGLNKSGSRDIFCYKCNEQGHFKNECPKLQKENPKKKIVKIKNKGLKAIRDSYDSSEEESEEELANITLMAHVGSSDINIHSEDEDNSKSESKETSVSI
ncbi:uncharacterized protein LOC131649162 [Vicia villosa]|uniref:uncharacterized protein LOC131649162 n=1 Tax=Vicia villosa TaxID=3911 RepID=UPI00273ACC42|nr:uncharacterized protein LOC131649162 [Vicia villosa]